MAAAIEDAPVSYFPPLEDILSGGHQLVSWRLAYATLLHLDLFGKAPLRLQQFLNDEKTIDVLAAEIEQPRPSPRSKGDFETRTAPIQVTPGENELYDIRQIKEDTLWLSQEVKLDEVAALRVVLLNWRQRHADSLLEGYTEEEVISLQSVLGGWADTLGGSTNPIPSHREEESVDARRIRLLNLYLSEDEAMLNSYISLQASLMRFADDPSLSAEPWIQEIANKVAQRQKRQWPPVDDPTDAKLRWLLEQLHDALVSLSLGCPWTLADRHPSLQERYGTSRLTRILFLLRSVYLLSIATTHLPSAETLQQWFAVTGSRDFFGTFSSENPQTQALIIQIQTVASLTSLTILQLPYTLSCLESEVYASDFSSFFTDVECVLYVSDVLYTSASRLSSLAAPSMLGWALMLQALKNAAGAMQAISTEEPSPSSVRKTKLSPGPLLATIHSIFERLERYDMDTDFIHYLCRAALDGDGVFPTLGHLSDALPAALDLPGSVAPEMHARTSFLDLMDMTCQILNQSGYNDTTFASVVSVLTLERSGRGASVSKPMRAALAHHFFQCEALEHFFLRQAVQRYPYELEPFLRLTKALSLLDQQGDAVTQMLERMPTLLVQLPPEYSHYRLLQEDDFYNAIALDRDLPIFVKSRTGGSFFGGPGSSTALVAADSKTLVIPANTRASVMGDSRPLICLFNFENSCFSFLGAALGTITSSSARFSPVGLTLLKSTQADAIALLASQVAGALTRETNAADARDAAKSILEQASDFLDSDNDIITVLFDIFEQELLEFGQNRDADSKRVLIECTSLFRSLLRVLPGRIWPLLARSSLLERDGQPGKLQTIVAVSEIVTGTYDFLVECAGLYSELVTNTVSQGITRPHPHKRAKIRFVQEDQDSVVPPKLVGTVLFAFTKVLVDAASSTPDWGFVNQTQRCDLNSTIWSTLDTVLNRAYNFEGGTRAGGSLTTCLSSAAQSIMHSFLATDRAAMSLRPLLKALTEGLQLATIAAESNYQTALTRQCQSALRLTRSLLMPRTDAAAPRLAFQNQVLSAMPTLTRLYAASYALRPALTRLLESIVSSIAQETQNPPSLLGNLSINAMEDFVKLLKTVSANLFDDDDLVNSTWRLMTTVVSGRQQWLATYLLTGKAPRASLFGATDRKASQSPAIIRTPSSLDIAMDELLKSNFAPSSPNLAKFAFVVTAQSSWPWVSTRLRSRNSFLDGAAEALGKVESVPANRISGDVAVRFAKSFQLNAHAAEMFSILAYNLRQLGDDQVARRVLPKLSIPGQMHFFSPSYNESLHSNLSRNLEIKFPGHKLEEFKRKQQDREFGKNFLYDIDLARAVLTSETVAGNDRGESFVQEIERANENLSLVEGQINAFNGWKLLIAQLSSQCSKDKALQDSLSFVVFDCLTQVVQEGESLTVLERIAQARVDLAATVLQQLALCGNEAIRRKSLLEPVLEVVRRSTQGSDLFGSESTLAFQRPPLRLLYLALRIQDGGDEAGTGENPRDGNQHGMAGKMLSQSEALLEICTEVVARGVRAIAEQLHEQEPAVLPSDLACLNGILHCIVSQPRFGFARSQVAVALANSGITRVALALFSWSDSLILRELKSANQGYALEYARHCVSLLLSMSTLPALAEFMATEGILSQLDGASILQNFRRPKGIGALEEDDSLQPLFGLWSRSILPLALNILVAVGNSIAAEMAIFLNSFPEQLQRAGTALEAATGGATADTYEGSLTLDEACEAHTLALISIALDRCRNAPGGGDVPELAWDRMEVREDVESWMQGSKAALQERLMATSDREARLAKEGKLEGLVRAELSGVLDCLEGLGEA